MAESVRSVDTRTVSCPSSTPALNENSVASRVTLDVVNSASTPAKPRPWSRPKVNTTAARRREGPAERRFSTPTYTTDSAIRGSTTCAGTDTTP